MSLFWALLQLSFPEDLVLIAAEFTKIQQISSMTQEEVQIFANTVAMAQLGKHNPDQITTEALASILELVRIATHTRKLVCPVQSAGNIFAMPMSYIYNRADIVFCITAKDVKCSRPTSTNLACELSTSKIPRLLPGTAIFRFSTPTRESSS